MRSSLIGTAFLGAGLLNAIWAVGFALRLPSIVQFWPWQDTRLSHIFIGSVCGAFAAGALWTWWRRNWGAARPSLAGLSVLFLLTGLYLAYRASAADPLPVGPHAAVFLVSGVGAALLFFLVGPNVSAGKQLPRLVRLSCTVFAVVLLLTGIGLIARYANIFPWPLSPESSTVFGCFFLGLAAVYALTARSGGVPEGIVVMLGFLVYDLILLPPLLGHFAAVAPERMPSLVIYVAVLGYSAVIALYLLLAERGQVLGRGMHPA